MTEIKHTPGPWAYEHCVVSGTLHVAAGAWPLGTNICEMGDTLLDEANARLIAAAPELLDALQETVEKFDASGSQEVFGTPLGINKARAAIAKATGAA